MLVAIICEDVERRDTEFHTKDLQYLRETTDYRKVSCSSVMHSLCIGVYGQDVD